MPGNACERCQSEVPASSYELYDYCAHCSKNLCPACMEKGCCGNVPAQGGAEADFPEEVELEVDPNLTEENPGNGPKAGI